METEKTRGGRKMVRISQMSGKILRSVLKALVCVGVVAVNAAGGALTYSAVGDWTGNNPSGPWSYLGASGWGGTFSPLGVYANPFDGVAPYVPPTPWVGLDSWHNGISQPYWEGVVHNQTNNPYSWITMILPPNLLQLDPQSGAVAVRFTPSQSGLYSVSGLFQTVDIYSLNPVHLGIVMNGSTALLDVNGFGGPGHYGGQLSFSYSPLYLSAGSTLDFIVAESTDYTYLSTGLGVTIQAIPEPAAYSLMAAGLALMVFIQRSGKRRMFWP
jgi:hypothetical protein